MKYTPEELDNAAIADWVADAEFAERQAVDGPLYPANGVTSESLLEYAAKCRGKIERYRASGAHKAMLANG